MGCIHVGLLRLLERGRIDHFILAQLQPTMISFSGQHSDQLQLSVTHDQNGSVSIISITHNSSPGHDTVVKIQLHILQDHPLFNWHTGDNLTREALSRTLNLLTAAAGTEPSHFSSHSFHITMVAAVGLPDQLIQSLCKWRSQHI